MSNIEALAEPYTCCLQSMGVAVKMVTGDQFAIAVETCKRLGMGSTIMEGKTVMAGLKVRIVAIILCLHVAHLLLACVILSGLG